MKAVELRKFSYTELGEKLDEAKEELFNLRFQLATNQLDNNIDIRVINERKGVIANLDTVDTRQPGRIIFSRCCMTDDDATTGTPADFICIAT